MIDVAKTRVELAEHALLRPVEGTGVMLDLESERYLGFDETALRMVETATNAANLEVAVSELTAIYDVDAETIRQDLVTLISDLNARGLMHILPAEGQS